MPVSVGATVRCLVFDSATARRKCLKRSGKASAVTDDFVCIVVMHSVVTTDDFTQSGYSHSECTKSQYDWQTTPQEPFR